MSRLHGCFPGDSADLVVHSRPDAATGRDAGNWKRAPTGFADSVSFSIPHPPGIPWVPEADSADGMRTFFELLQTHVQAKEFDLVRQVIAEGEDDDRRSGSCARNHAPGFRRAASARCPLPAARCDGGDLKRK
ncbi:hypothetical protein ACFWUZ_22380 [Streptomyces sp. NPDC058646]|uniref:hypothetical protein n=1 Tax=Streptomyces sp. NPDC058646 TaxID=3346574 RepID=UPI003665012E